MRTDIPGAPPHRKSLGAGARRARVIADALQPHEDAQDIDKVPALQGLLSAGL